MVKKIFSDDVKTTKELIITPGALIENVKKTISSDVSEDLIKKGEFDATDIITHKLKLDEGKHAYEIFDKKLEDCIKVILKP